MAALFRARAWRLECEMFAPVSIGEAFSIFENPGNLSAITPPWLNFRIVTPERIEMRRGARIDYVIRWLGIRVKWKTLITGYEPPHSFVDEQIRGPYALWRHRHTFREIAGGTMISDCVDYRLSFSVIGDIAHALVVRKQLIGIFRYRQHAITAMLQANRPLEIRSAGPAVRRVAGP